MTFAFSPEADLYARNFEVVEEMRARFERDLETLLDQVAAALKARPWPEAAPGGTAPRPVHTRQAGSAYYFLSRDETPAVDKQPVAWCSWRDPGIVRDRGIVFAVSRHAGSPEQRERVAALMAEPVITTSRFGDKAGQKYREFELWLGWAPDEDPVTTLAEALVPVLVLLDGAR